MEKDKLVKIANGEKVAKGGGSLGHRIYGDLKNFATTNHGIVNPLLAGGAANLVAKATGSRRAGRSMMKDLGNVSMAGGKTLNESLGRSELGTSTNDGFMRRMWDKGTGWIDPKARMRNEAREGQDRGLMSRTLNKSLGSYKDMEKTRDAYKANNRQGDFYNKIDKMNSGFGKVTSGLEGGKVTPTNEANKFGSAAAIPGAISAFIKSPVAKNLGKTMAKGTALGAGDALGNKMVNGEKPEATKNTVKTKPLGH